MGDLKGHGFAPQKERNKAATESPLNSLISGDIEVLVIAYPLHGIENVSLTMYALTYQLFGAGEIAQ